MLSRRSARDARPVVGDDDAASLVVGRDRHVDRAAARRIRERIEHEVREDLRDVERPGDLRARIGRARRRDGRSARWASTTSALQISSTIAPTSRCSSMRGLPIGVPGEVTGDACALLDDRQRVGHVLGRGARRARLTDPAEQDRERVRHVVEDAREIAVGIRRLRHGAERYDNSSATSPRAFTALRQRPRRSRRPRPPVARAFRGRCAGDPCRSGESSDGGTRGCRAGRRA